MLDKSKLIDEILSWLEEPVFSPPKARYVETVTKGYVDATIDGGVEFLASVYSVDALPHISEEDDAHKICFVEEDNACYVSTGEGWKLFSGSLTAGPGLQVSHTFLVTASSDPKDNGIYVTVDKVK
jgi:hypothetical protein